jgi:hypothetical protein
MMAVIFALMLGALFLAWRGSARAATLCALTALALSAGLFLFEIYNPEYGFRMPWIQVSVPIAPGEG